MIPPRFFTLGMKFSIAAALLLLASAFIMLVLPGFAIYQAGDLPFGRYFGEVHGDNLLPIAMQTQLLWAPAIPILYAVVRRVARRAAGAEGHTILPLPARIGATLGFLCGLYAWAVVLALLFHSQLGRSPGG